MAINLLTVKPSPEYQAKLKNFCTQLGNQVAIGKITIKDAIKQAKAFAKAHFDCEVITEEEE